MASANAMRARLGCQMVAGVCLGLLMGAKLFFGLFLLSLLWARQTRAATVALVVLLLTLLAGLYPGGL